MKDHQHVFMVLAAFSAGLFIMIPGIVVALKIESFISSVLYSLTFFISGIVLCVLVFHGGNYLFVSNGSQAYLIISLMLVGLLANCLRQFADLKAMKSLDP